MTDDHSSPSGSDEIEMPRPTIAPLVLVLGIVLLCAGLALSIAFSVVGAVVFGVGLAAWIDHLLPGRGHVHVPVVEPHERPSPIVTAPGTVEQLQVGMPGYR